MLKELSKKLILIFICLIFTVGGCLEQTDYIQRGDYESNIGNYSTAIKYYKKALNKTDNKINLYIKIGNIYRLKLLNKQEALEIYLKGIEDYPNNFELNVYIMQLYFDLGKTEKGVSFYKKCSKIRNEKQSYSFPWEFINSIKMKQSQDEFIKFCKKFLAINPSDTILREELSIVYLNTNEVLKAKRELETLLTYGDKTGYVYFQLAMCNFNLGKNQEALNQFLQARKLGTNVPQKYIDVVKNKIVEKSAVPKGKNPGRL